MSDDEDSDQDMTNENDADVIANQIFGDDDDDTAPASSQQDERSQSSLKGDATAADNQYGDMDESEESGTHVIVSSDLQHKSVFQIISYLFITLVWV